MNKLYMPLILLLLLLITACDHSATAKTNIIFSADLTDRENTITSTAFGNAFVFDYMIDADFAEAAVWAEKYEFGKLTDEKTGYMKTSLHPPKGSIIIGLSKPVNAEQSEQPQTYYIGLGDQFGTSSGTFTENIPGITENMDVVSSQLADKTAVIDNKDTVLAAAAYTDDEFGTSSISSDFFADPKAHMDELKAYNIVYLFKVKFIKH